MNIVNKVVNNVVNTTVNDEQATLEELTETYRTILRTLHAAMAPVWMQLELSMAQLKTLFVLSDETDMPIGQVAEMLGIGLPTASHLVERLVQAGLAERTEDTQDRRRMLARLSPAGEALSERLRQGSRDRLQHWLGQLTEEEQAALLIGLRALQRVSQQVESASNQSQSNP